MGNTDWPIYNYRNLHSLPNILFSGISLLLLFPISIKLGLYYKSDIIWGISTALMFIGWFYGLDKYFSNHEEIGKLNISEYEINIQIENQNYKLEIKSIKQINFYYYYSDNRFAHHHELQKIIDIEIEWRGSKLNLLCPVKNGKENLITNFKKLGYSAKFNDRRRKYSTRKIGVQSQENG